MPHTSIPNQYDTRNIYAQRMVFTQTFWPAFGEKPTQYMQEFMFLESLTR